MLGDVVNIYLEHNESPLPEPIVVQQLEQRQIGFVIRTHDGTPIDVSACTFTLTVKADPQYASVVLVKEDGFFDKSGGASGVVSVSFEDDDLDLEPGNYFAELQIEGIADNALVRSKLIPFQVLESVT